MYHSVNYSNASQSIDYVALKFNCMLGKSKSHTQTVNRTSSVLLVNFHHHLTVGKFALGKNPKLKYN